MQPRNAKKTRGALEGGSEGARDATLENGNDADCNDHKIDKVEPQPINAEQLRYA